METTLKVSKIKDGTVIDHVPAGKALRVVSILKIENNPDVSTTIAMRVQSDKLGRKDVIKVENKYLNRDDLDRISLIAPDATISIVNNYQIKEKFTVKLTKTVVGILRCPNQGCITNVKEPVNSEFSVISEKPLVLRCFYCERNMSEKEVIAQL
ncbi:MAG: aspartate carbamoyltransferase regulatory subunit [Thermoplasmatales archaeon B_DKE]|nr:MAG: aspartate carbamoyltransferase regulatory subunit [Thermoplasmatales archaeon B_DKE]QRF76413.1 Aspartate carbamoyltransferase regulatory chain [Thermoplasmatales archaeon]